MGIQIYKRAYLFIAGLIASLQPVMGLSIPLFDVTAATQAVVLTTEHRTPLPEQPFFDTVITITDLRQLPSFTQITPTEQAIILITAQHAMLRLLLPLMEQVLTYQKYWQEQQYHPYSHLLSQPPHRWFGRKSHQEIVKDNLLVLATVQQILAKYMGTFKSNLDAYTHIQTPGQLQELVEEQHAYLAGFFGHTAHPDPTKNIAIIIQGFKEYHQGTQKLLNLYKQDGHIARNWLAYTTAALTAGAAAYWYFNDPIAHKVWIEGIINRRAQEATNFWTEYIQKPILKFRTALFEKKDLPKPFDEDPTPPIVDYIRGSQEAYKAFDVKLPESFYPDLVILKKAIDTKAPNARELAEQFYIKHHVEIDHIATDLGFDGYNLNGYDFIDPMGKMRAIIGCLYTKLQSTKITALITANNVSKLSQSTIEALQLIMPIIATIPACALFYLSFSAVRAAYHKIAPHKVAHKGILKTLLNAEEILNDNSDKQQLDIVSLGLFTYYLGMLYTYAQDLSPQEAYEFNKDITKLSSCTRTIAQKLKDVEIIRKKYQFLT